MSKIIATSASSAKSGLQMRSSNARQGLSVANKTTAASELGKKQRVLAEKTTPASTVKKFDLAASLKRPVTWQMKKGKCI